MLKSIGIAKLLFVTLIISACSYVTAVPTTKYAPTEGIPIPTVKPLLVISGGQASILFVPNMNRTYALRFGSFLAKHEFSADLQNGMLTKLSSKQDGTDVPIALIKLVQAAVEKGVPIGAAFSGQVNDAAGGGLVQVYDIIFSEEGDFIALKPLLHPQDFIRMPNGNVRSQVPAPKSTLPAAKKDVN